MALFRSRSRYGRLSILAAIMTGLYFLSSWIQGTSTSSSFTISTASIIQWSQQTYTDQPPTFEEPERPQPKLPTPPLSKKHKTRNGRPLNTGPAASARGSRTQSSSKAVDIPSHDDDAKANAQPPPPPPGLHLPDSPDFTDPQNASSTAGSPKTTSLAHGQNTNRHPSSKGTYPTPFPS